MGKIEQLAQRLKQLTPDAVGNVLLEAIEKQSVKAVQMNTNQLWGGRRADGVFLPKYKGGKRKNTRVQLFDKGDFYAGFFVRAKWPISISSFDSKRNILVRRYGKEIFGLDKANLKEFSRLYILPVLEKKIKRALGVR